MPDRPMVNDGNGNTVPLRVYIERIFEERQASHWAIHDLHNHQHEQQHVQEGIARKLALDNVDGRLAKLNDLRSDVEKDRSLYLTRDKYDSENDAIAHRLAALENWRAKAIGVGSVLVLFSGFLGAVIFKAFGG